MSEIWSAQTEAEENAVYRKPQKRNYRESIDEGAKLSALAIQALRDSVGTYPNSRILMYPKPVVIPKDPANQTPQTDS
jgi:hypothetical protein